MGNRIPVFSMERFMEALMKRSVLVITAILLILAWGGVSAYQMQRDYLPPINNSTLMITVRADSYDAAQVKNTIANPVEQVVRGIDGLQSLELNSYDGGLFASLYFPLNFDVARAEQELARSLHTLQLPPGVQKPAVTRVSTSSFPIMRIALIGQSTTNERTLRSSLQDNLVKELRTVSGVKEVLTTGAGNNGFIVTVRMQDLTAQGLTLRDVERSLAVQNLTWPRGHIDNGQVSIPFQVEGWNLTTDSLQQTPIQNTDGKIAPLSAVANVSQGIVDLQTIARTDSQPSVLIDVMKTPSSNITELSDRIHGKIQELQSSLPKDVKLTVLYDYGEQVKSSLSGLLKEGLLGSFFSMGSVFLFLRNVRSTLLIALTVPVSLLATAGLLHAMGISLNLLTVSGLVVAMGRVVDDSIVILDNIFRRMRELEDASRLSVLVSAVREMVPAVVSSTLTTVAVFLPIALVGGMISAAFSAFSWAVVSALLISLLVSLVVLPALSRYGVSFSGKQTGMKLDQWAEQVLTWTFRRKTLVVFMSLAVLLTTVVMAVRMPVNVLSAGRSGEISIEAELPEGSSLTAVNSEVQKIEQLLRSEPNVASYSATLGSSFTPQFDDVFDEGGGWIQRGMRQPSLSLCEKGLM